VLMVLTHLFSQAFVGRVRVQSSTLALRNTTRSQLTKATNRFHSRNFHSGRKSVSVI
jgi:hypothetical protein